MQMNLHEKEYQQCHWAGANTRKSGRIMTCRNTRKEDQQAANLKEINKNKQEGCI